MNVVIGLGKTGLSCIKFLKAHGLPVAVTDSRANPPGVDELEKIAPEIEKRFGAFSEELILNATSLIINPGISLKEPVIAKAIQKGIPYTGDIGLFIQAAQAPIIAITGSNAKSTVVTLVGEMAKEAGMNVAVGGNLGTPALSLLDKNIKLYVLELSSFQLDTTFNLRAKVAAILNITEDHMDRYTTFDDYVKAKQRIYQGAQIAVYNRADENTQPQEMVGRVVSFGLSDQADFGLRDNHYLVTGDEILVDVHDLPLQATHHYENSLSALAIADAAGIPLNAAIAVLKRFKGLTHRCQLVRELDGVQWINDSKGTNVGATVAALKSFGRDKNLILIAGGDGKGADFSPLLPLIQHSVKQLILLGRDAKIIGDCCKDVTKITYVQTLQEAILFANKISTDGEIVLLSPACSSLDMFKNFEDRGEQFMEAVRAL